MVESGNEKCGPETISSGNLSAPGINGNEISTLNVRTPVASETPNCESVDFNYYLRYDSHLNALSDNNVGDMNLFVDSISSALEQNRCDYLMTD